MEEEGDQLGGVVECSLRSLRLRSEMFSRHGEELSKVQIDFYMSRKSEGYERL